jgi:hypothetical protein
VNREVLSLDLNREGVRLTECDVCFALLLPDRRQAHVNALHGGGDR